MASLVEDLRGDARCGCYADGAGTASRPVVVHHCVTCRAAERIEKLEAALGQLVAAKDEKDANGETPRYRAMKAGTWERAREILKG